jgi:hypothetical protein
MGKRRRRKTVPEESKRRTENYKKRTSEFGFLSN